MVTITVVQTGTDYTATVLSTSPFFIKSVVGDVNRMEKISKAILDCNANILPVAELQLLLEPKENCEKQQKIINLKEDLANLNVDFSEIAHKVPWLDKIGGKLYKVGTAVSLPDILVADIVSAAKSNNTEQLKSYSYFWDNCLLNPNPQARKDLFKWLTDNGLRITSAGNVIAYRRAVLVKNTSVDNYDLILKTYNKLIATGKNPNDYCVVERFFYDDHDDAVMELEEIIAEGVDEDDLTPIHTTVQEMRISDYESGVKDAWGEEDYYFDLILVNNVGAAYANFRQESDTVRRYTDAHTKRKDYRLGQTAREDRNLCDHNPANACSYGLHCGTKNFAFGGFGNVLLGVLFNPKDVIAVPTHDVRKIRVAELYFFTEFENETAMREFNDGDVTVFENAYMSIKKEEYAELLKNINNSDFESAGLNMADKIQEKIEQLHSELNINTTSDVPYAEKIRILKAKMAI